MMCKLSSSNPPGHWRCVFRLNDPAARLVLNIVAVLGCEEWAIRLAGNDLLIGPSFRTRQQADQWGNAEVDRARGRHALPRSAIIYVRAEHLLDQDA